MNEQINEMIKIMNECCNRYDEQGNLIGNKCFECEEWSDDNHCCCSYNSKQAIALYNAGYRKQSENIARIPCNVGDLIYMPWSFQGDKAIAFLTVTMIVIDRYCFRVFTDFDSDDDDYFDRYNGGIFLAEDFGRVVFTSLDEAQDALVNM